jgi:hypothetical protein
MNARNDEHPVLILRTSDEEKFSQRVGFSTETVSQRIQQNTARTD